MLCINTDFEVDHGEAEPVLRQISQAGFSHVHWCHHWNDDFVYRDQEVEHIGSLLAKYRLTLCGIHASEGVEMRWASALEHQRREGLKLVVNRMTMAQRLGADYIVLHVPPLPQAADLDGYWDALQRSLMSLQGASRRTGVRIALENGLLEHNAHFDVLGRLFARWPADFLGLCYDSGHGNIDGDGLDHLDNFKSRLIAMHLHDNDGRNDQHCLPYSGTIDWRRLSRIVAASTYGGPLMLELIKPQDRDAGEFLSDAFRAGMRLTAAVEASR